MKNKLTYDVDDLRELTGLGKNQCYQLCNTPGFPAFRVGKRILIPVESLNEWLREQAQGRDAE